MICALNCLLLCYAMFLVCFIDCHLDWPAGGRRTKTKHGVATYLYAIEQIADHPNP